MRRIVFTLALLASGCALSSDRLRLRVARPELVELQSVPIASGWVARYDLAHPTTVLPAAAGARTAVAPFRTGAATARRNGDGSIDLVVPSGVWQVVRADGTITPLRDDAYALGQRGVTWAFLAAPRRGPNVHAPWQLRIATAADNVRDARILVRRERFEGWLFTGFGALVGLTAVPSFAFGFRDLGSGDAPDAAIALGAFALVGAALAIGYGLYALLVHEHDEVLTDSIAKPSQN
ncbi:MAG TPA: hypothetical protein VGH28_02460 [Polyangiaceae bacterium]|jgi:hypothetical protein